jgi:hypothetical protein
MERLRGPHFICVGPEKTGTSWLYNNFYRHPDLFLTPVKELRYFYESMAYPDESRLDRLCRSSDWHAMQYRNYLKERSKYYSKHPKSLILGWRRFVWDWRYLFGKHNDGWYLSMFDLADGKLAGEISPQYFFMPEDQIIHIKQLLPRLKVIALLRNPIDWCWSFARMAVIKYGKGNEASEDDFFEFFNKKIEQCQFAPAIKRWRRHFDSEHLYVGFYDKLREKPDELFQEICKFLNIEPNRAPAKVMDRLSKVVNPGESLGLSAHLTRHLALGWKADIEELCHIFSPYPQKWKQSVDKIIAGL